MPLKHYTGEVGTVIRLDCGQDISAALNTTIYCRFPDGTTTEWEAEIYDTQYLQYTVGSGDLTQIGTYKVQAGLTLGEWQGRGETAVFTIHPLYG